MSSSDTKISFLNCENPPVALPPPIDSATLVSNSIGNIAFANTLLDELESYGRKQVNSIEASLADERLEEAEESAHSLKGAAGIIGAQLLRDLATQIELACRAGDAMKAKSANRFLLCEIDRCVNYIPALRMLLNQNEK